VEGREISSRRVERDYSVFCTIECAECLRHSDIFSHVGFRDQDKRCKECSTWKDAKGLLLKWEIDAIDWDEVSSGLWSGCRAQGHSEGYGARPSPEIRGGM
jgi:ribosomal protein S27E